MYVIDTNLYVRAEGDPAFRTALRDFLGRAAGRVLVSTVVLHELLVGAHTEAAREAIVRNVATPFQRHLRVVETGLRVWRDAALITRRLDGLGGYADKLRTVGFRHDILIAASCRRVGATLVTANRGDFELIDSVRGLRFATSFPE